MTFKVDLDRIKMGMIGLVESDGDFLSRTIESEQLDESYPPEAAKYVHAFVSGGEEDEVSSTFPHTKRRTISAYRGRGILFLYHKSPMFRDRLRYKFAFFCASEANKPYPVQALTWWLLPDWLKGSSNWLCGKWLKFCSALVSWGLVKIGLDPWPDVPDNVIMPAALYVCDFFEHSYYLPPDWEL